MNITKTKLYLIALIFITLSCQNTEQKNTQQVKHYETFQLVDEFNYNEPYPFGETNLVKKPLLLNGQQYCVGYYINREYDDLNQPRINSITSFIGECNDKNVLGLNQTSIPWTTIAKTLEMKYEFQKVESDDHRKKMESIKVSQDCLAARMKFETNVDAELEKKGLLREVNSFLFKSIDGRVMVILRYDDQTKNMTSIEYHAYEDWRKDIQKKIDTEIQLYNILLENNGL